MVETREVRVSYYNDDGQRVHYDAFISDEGIAAILSILDNDVEIDDNEED
jgi:hypothetical protein